MDLASVTFEASEQHPLLRWRVNQATLWSQHIFTKDETIRQSFIGDFNDQNKTFGAGKLKVSFKILSKSTKTTPSSDKSNAPRRYRTLMPYLVAALLCYCF